MTERAAGGGAAGVVAVAGPEAGAVPARVRVASLVLMEVMLSPHPRGSPGR